MIFCFSGNGNTLYIARQLSALLGHKLINLRGKLLTTPDAEPLHVPEGEDVVWMFPVYSWGIPPIVRDFIMNVRLQAVHDARHHMVATMGDDAGLTDKMWRKLMAARGWQSASAQGVIMPNTYTLMKGFDVDTTKVADEKLRQAAERVKEIADTIRSGKCITDINRGSFAWVKSHIIYPWFVRYAITPDKFHSHDCIGCGKCVEICPMNNISLSESSTPHPVWGDKCAMCLGCYNVCPRHAIEYASSTAKKGQYHCPIH